MLEWKSGDLSFTSITSFGIYYSVSGKLVNFSGPLCLMFVLFYFVSYGKQEGNKKTFCNYGQEASRKHVDLTDEGNKAEEHIQSFKRRVHLSIYQNSISCQKRYLKAKMIKIIKFRMVIIFLGRASIVLVTFYFSN